MLKRFWIWLIKNDLSIPKILVICIPLPTVIGITSLANSKLEFCWTNDCWEYFFQSYSASITVFGAEVILLGIVISLKRLQMSNTQLTQVQQQLNNQGIQILNQQKQLNEQMLDRHKRDFRQSFQDFEDHNWHALDFSFLNNYHLLYPKFKYFNFEVSEGFCSWIDGYSQELTSFSEQLPELEPKRFLDLNLYSRLFDEIVFTVGNILEIKNHSSTIEKTPSIRFDFICTRTSNAWNLLRNYIEDISFILKKINDFEGGEIVDKVFFQVSNKCSTNMIERIISIERAQSVIEFKQPRIDRRIDIKGSEENLERNREYFTNGFSWLYLLESLDLLREVNGNDHTAIDELISSIRSLR